MHYLNCGIPVQNKFCCAVRLYHVLQFEKSFNGIVNSYGNSIKLENSINSNTRLKIKPDLKLMFKGNHERQLHIKSYCIRKTW